VLVSGDSADTIVEMVDAAVGERQLPLIWSKLQPPVSRRRVSRRRLLDVLCGSPRRLTLIRAPAGWGKSTLLADWHECERETRPFAWLALDEHDNDPVRFWTYVIEALHTVRPELGESSRSLVHTPGVDLGEVMVPVLVNELDATPGEVVFVLDDYHLITHDAIHEGLRLLLAHLPRSVELVIATRTEPQVSLSRMRANGELVEIDSRSLSFSPDEAAELLNDQLALSIDHDAVSTLCTRTEGWAAGLYLAALSLASREDSYAFIEAFAGDDRGVVDYLREEVLAAQPGKVRTFLRRTSILERFSASLCDAVIGSTGSVRILAEIEGSNSFLVPLDTRREWYRYHHLFGELLRQELDDVEGETAPELHRRAATWLLGAGFWSEGILHTIAAGEIDAASELIVRHWLEFRDLHRLETILGWLAKLPDEQIERDPRLCLVKAATLIELGRESEGSALLEIAERGAATLPDSAEGASVRSGVVANRVILDYLRGNVRGIRAKAGSSLDREEEGDPYWESVLLTTLGSALFLSGRGEAAAETLARATRESEDAGHALALTHALGWQAVVLAEVGDLNGARGALEATDAAIRDRSDLREYYGTSLTHIVRGGLLERDSLGAEANAAMARGVELAVRSGSALQAAYALTEHTRLKHELGDHDGAVSLLRETRRVVDACSDPGILAERTTKLGARLAGMAGGGLDALSERELQVGRLVVARKTNPEIAAELFISLKTVETHMRHIFEKLGVSSRVEVARAIESADSANRAAGSNTP
jgi:LuxR family maltose regulon positive regulatory protein